MSSEPHSRYLLLILATCLSLLGTDASANTMPEAFVVVRGELGSAPNQVGAPIQNNYEVLPQAIAVAADGRIFVADHINDKIVLYDKKGQWQSAIPFPVKGEHKGVWTISDMTTDPHGNLYVASRYAMEIRKFGNDGRPLGSINLANLDICWSAQKGWIACGIQIGRIIVATDGSIFLRGYDELIHLSPSGNVLKKWMLPAGQMFAVDSHSNVYLVDSDLMVEGYDPTGRLLWKRKCGKSPSRHEDGRCLLPISIDQDGNMYWFLKHGTRVIKTNRSGRPLATLELGSFQLLGNTAKIDSHGDLYFLNSTKKEFWIQKVKFPSTSPPP